MEDSSGIVREIGFVIEWIYLCLRSQQAHQFTRISIHGYVFIFFAHPKKTNQKKGCPNPCPLSRVPSKTAFLRARQTGPFPLARSHIPVRTLRADPQKNGHFGCG